MYLKRNKIGLISSKSSTTLLTASRSQVAAEPFDLDCQDCSFSRALELTATTSSAATAVVDANRNSLANHF